jgi:hypothetical protein
MLADPELVLQQCRIFQNQSKHSVVIPSRHEYEFYNSLDGSAQNGRRIKITFAGEKITESSYLIGRLIFCDNGDEFLSELSESLPELGEISNFTNSENLRATVNKYMPARNSLFQGYSTQYDFNDESRRHFLYLEPMGEGLKSYSFEIKVLGVYPEPSL